MGMETPPASPSVLQVTRVVRHLRTLSAVQSVPLFAFSLVYPCAGCAESSASFRTKFVLLSAYSPRPSSCLTAFLNSPRSSGPCQGALFHPPHVLSAETVSDIRVQGADTIRQHSLPLLPPVVTSPASHGLPSSAVPRPRSFLRAPARRCQEERAGGVSVHHVPSTSLP